MNLSKKIILGMSITIIILIIGFNYKSVKPNKYVDIHSLVKEAYINPNEYDFNMAKNFSKEVYNYSNIYRNKSIHKG